MKPGFALLAAALMLSFAFAGPRVPTELPSLPPPAPLNAINVVNWPTDENGNLKVSVSRHQYALAGFTTTVFTGGVGMFTFSKACARRFPGSRMCSSEEVLATNPIPDLSSGGADWAWVLPVVRAGAMGTNWSVEIVDATGLEGYPGTLTCVGWEDSSAAGGLSVSKEGRWTTNPCNSQLSVACCAPQL